MPRPLRIEFQNAWYHVKNRGHPHCDVFVRDSDYQAFIDLLQDVSERLKLRVAGYCLMPNHYHLVVQTPLRNLSRCMQHVDGVYTQKFNRSRGINGVVFRSRYKCILIEEESYLLPLVRYVHQYPLKTKIVNVMEKYPWSSHQGYLSSSSQWDWLHKDYVLSRFSDVRERQIRLYNEFMSYDEPNQEIAVLEKNRWPSILGSKEFVAGIKQRYLVEEYKDPTTDISPSIHEITQAVCRFYKKNPKDLQKSVRGEFNEPRNMAIYICRRIRPDTLTDIGNHFGLHNDSSVSSVINRMKRLVKTDPAIRENVEKLIHKLNRK